MKKIIVLSIAIIMLVSCGKQGQTSKNHNNENQTVSEKADTSEIKDQKTEAPGVDLGLSVNWAECNVGAKAPEQIGSRIPLGNTTGTVKANRSAGSHVSGTENDIAVVKLGEGWRMPTGQEMKELMEKCQWEKETINGRNGFRVTGPNGNSIFLPNTGDNYQPESLADYDYSAGEGNDVSSYGNYWCGTPADDTIGLNQLHFNSQTGEYRFLVCEPISLNAVRPVHDK